MAFLFRILSYLPLPLLHNLGALLGWVIRAIGHAADNSVEIA